MSYGEMAYLYDRLMSDVPYTSWLQLIEEKSLLHGVKGKRILDLGCGTGEISIMLAGAGYEVTGVDLSEDMLIVAQEKTSSHGVKVDFIQQDMTELEVWNSYDIIGIFCDSLNYVTREEDVIRTFQRVKEFLKEDGLFLFDVHSLYKINEIFIGETYTYDENGIAYIWDCFAGEEENSVEHELAFFVEDESGKYDRFDEYHVQRTFSIDLYKKWLENTGFEILEILGDFEGPVHASTERIFFVAKLK